MKKFLVTSFLTAALLAGYAQKESNVWCFGNRAMLNFNSGSPVVSAVAAINTTEGCSSIADSMGNLLFYTDGQTVWNKNHIAMPNGTGLGGGGSSTQSGIIVKQPGSASIYYVFTTAEAQGANGFRYSTVDMTLQGGLGNVVTKNVAVQSNMSEKLTGVKHANGTDVWIMVHPLNSNGFYAYLLTAAGFSLTPVISNTGTAHLNGSGDEIGYLKFSHDGKKLACAVRYQYFYELFDFNNATGVVSKPIHFNSGSVCYGVEFSPDNSKLYFSDNNLWQVDLSSNDSATIVASKKSISAGIQWALQLAPDNKIYIAMFSQYLSVINNPDALGAACGFVMNALNLGSASSTLGLPNYVASYTGTTIPPPIASGQASDSVLCASDCISFSDHSSNNPTSWRWTFSGGTPSSSSDQHPPFVCYFNPGSYAVKLVVSNGGGSDSVTFNNYINVATSPVAPVITVSGSTLYTSTDTGYVSYQWYDDTTLIIGATDTSLVINHDGNYNLQVKNRNGCSVAVGINIVLGLETAADEKSVYIYPNPAQDKLTVKDKTGIERIEIYDMLGKKHIGLGQRSQSQVDIDISSLSKGIYWLSVFSEESRQVIRLLKQ